MNVKLITHMGSDLSVVNAARVSFAKEHKEFKEPADTRLINYLAKHKGKFSSDKIKIPVRKKNKKKNK